MQILTPDVMQTRLALARSSFSRFEGRKFAGLCFVSAELVGLFGVAYIFPSREPCVECGRPRSLIDIHCEANSTLLFFAESLP